MIRLWAPISWHVSWQHLGDLYSLIYICYILIHLIHLLSNCQHIPRSRGMMVLWTEAPIRLSYVYVSACTICPFLQSKSCRYFHWVNKQSKIMLATFITCLMRILVYAKLKQNHPFCGSKIAKAAYSRENGAVWGLSRDFVLGERNEIPGYSMRLPDPCVLCSKVHFQMCTPVSHLYMIKAMFGNRFDSIVSFTGVRWSAELEVRLCSPWLRRYSPRQ